MDAEHLIERFRKAHGLTQQELAARLGISQARVSHYVTGRNTLPVEIAYAFIELARSHGESYTLEDVYPAPSAA